MTIGVVGERLRPQVVAEFVVSTFCRSRVTLRDHAPHLAFLFGQRLIVSMFLDGDGDADGNLGRQAGPAPPRCRPVVNLRYGVRLSARPPGFTVRYTRRVRGAEWEIYLVNEVRDWLDSLDPTTHTRIVQAIDTLAEAGPGLGRPLVDTIHGSAIANLKELRPGTVRILFVFDPWRSSILLVAGDKAGRWNDWYRDAIPLAEQRYEMYLKERAEEEGRQP
jgi:hypothetical protein